MFTLIHAPNTNFGITRIQNECSSIILKILTMACLLGGGREKENNGERKYRGRIFTVDGRRIRVQNWLIEPKTSQQPQDWNTCTSSRICFDFEYSFEYLAFNTACIAISVNRILALYSHFRLSVSLCVCPSTIFSPQYDLLDHTNQIFSDTNVQPFIHYPSWPTTPTHNPRNLTFYQLNSVLRLTYMSIYVPSSSCYSLQGDLIQLYFMISL